MSEPVLRKTQVVLFLSLLLTGCMTTRYVPFEPSESSSYGSKIRITLNNRLQYVFEDATIDDETVFGTALDHGFLSIPRADIKVIEKADGETFDSHTALRLTGIVLTLAAIIAASCAIDKDCAGRDSSVSGR